jgi:RNA polymerase sigma factor (sigma-70 family)
MTVELPVPLDSVRNRVYNICYQILRHRQDSEDATQEVLLKIADNAHTLKDPRQFAGWVSRIAFNEALDMKRKRTARCRSEASQGDPGPHDGKELAEIVAQAMAALDHDPRAVLVERFFEKRTLQEMARERGCTTVAVWYRVLRAKAMLRKVLIRAGLGASLGMMMAFLGSIQPVSARSTCRAPASAGLVAKGTSATRETLLAVLAVGALILAGGAGVRAWRHSDQVPGILLPESQAKVTGSASVPPSPPPAGTTAAAPDDSLKARLARLRDWIVANHEQYVEKFNRLKDDPEGRESAHAEYQKTYDELTRGLRELIFSDGRTYVEFLKPIHDPSVLAGLLFPLPRLPLRDLDDAPDPLLRGLAELLQTGSEIQRREILNVVWTAPSVPEAFLSVYDFLLAAPSPEVQRLTLTALAGGGRLSERHVPVMQEMVVSGRDPQLLSTAIQNLAGMASPAANRFILELFHSTVRTDIMDALGEFLPAVLARNRQDLDVHAEGLKRAFTQVSGRPPESATQDYGSDGYFYRRLVYVTVDQLPSSHVQDVLSSALDRAPSAQLKEGTRKILQAIEKGETRRDALVKVYLRHLDGAGAGTR